MLRRRRAECVFKYSVSFGESLVDVAGAKFEVVADIGLPPGLDVSKIGKRLRRSVLLVHER